MNQAQWLLLKAPASHPRLKVECLKCGVETFGMTAVPEVVLANEAGLCYASISMVTDYDCWRDDHDPVGFYGSASLMLLLCLKLSSPFKRLLFLRSKRFWYCVTPIISSLPEKVQFSVSRMGHHISPPNFFWHLHIRMKLGKGQNAPFFHL